VEEAERGLHHEERPPAVGDAGHEDGWHPAAEEQGDEAEAAAAVNGKKAAALAGFVVLGLSPSFVDWQQSDGDARRKAEILAFYALGLTLVYVGLLSG